MFGDKTIRRIADNHADVAWSGTRQLQIGRVEYRFDRGNDRDVIAKQREILDAFFFRSQHSECGAGHRCFEAQREEDDLPVGFSLAIRRESRGE